MRYMPPHQASRLMNRVRDLVRDKVFTKDHTALMDYLLFRRRKHGQDRIQVSYSTMAENLPIRRATLVQAIRDFEVAGLLEKQRTRLKVGIWRVQQWRNIYVFACPPQSSQGGTTLREVSKQEAREQGIAAAARPAGPVSTMVEDALSRLGARVREAPA